VALPALRGDSTTRAMSLLEDDPASQGLVQGQFEGRLDVLLCVHCSRAARHIFSRGMGGLERGSGSGPCRGRTCNLVLESPSVKSMQRRFRCGLMCGGRDDGRRTCASPPEQGIEPPPSTGIACPGPTSPKLSLRREYPPQLGRRGAGGARRGAKGGPTGINLEPCTLQHSGRGCVPQPYDPSQPRHFTATLAEHLHGLPHADRYHEGGGEGDEVEETIHGQEALAHHVG
jgi:hypothetical protein